MLRDRLLGNLVSKTIRDWLIWTCIAVFTLWAMTALYVAMMAATGDEYVSLLADMPEFMANVYGEHGGTAAGLAMSGIYTLMAPLVLLTYAIGLGASAAVGEEEARTLPLLLSSPLRRRRILLAKTGVATGGVVLIVILTWLGAAGLSALFGMDLTELNVAGASVQLLGMVFFFGALALGISAWRGSSAMGIGLAAGLAVLSYFVTTMMPVVEDLAELARFTPWYLYTGAHPLSRGIDPALLLIGVALAAALLVLGMLALDRRDLKA